MTPICFVSFNKQGDITRTVKRRDAWSSVPLFTAAQLAEAIRKERETVCAEFAKVQMKDVEPK